jgi:hypothetical protein
MAGESWFAHWQVDKAGLNQIKKRVPASATTCFAQRSLAVMPPGLALALGPVLQKIAEITVKIKQYDRQIQQLGQAEYPKTQALLKAHGVGHFTALTFVLAPIGTELSWGQLIQSANRNPTCSRNESKSNNKSKGPMKEKSEKQALTSVTCS